MIFLTLADVMVYGRIAHCTICRVTRLRLLKTAFDAPDSILATFDLRELPNK
jgi:hypothetical protein